MRSRLLNQASNFTAARRIAAIACLVALCGVIFGVGAAFGRPHAARRAYFARPARISWHAVGHHHARAAAGDRGHKARHSHPARRRHTTRKHKHLRRLYMRRTVARAARRHGRRHHHRLNVRAAHARHAGQGRHHGRNRHPKHGGAKRRLMHALMMRDFAVASAKAKIAHSTALLNNGAVSTVTPVASSGTAVASGPAGSAGAGLNSTLAGSDTGQLTAIATRVRTYAASTEAASSGRPAIAARAHRSAKAAKSAHHSSKLGGGFTFPFVTQTSQIERFVNVIPESIWIALATALALAGLGGAAAVRSGRRARRQAGEFAAVAAVALTDPLTGVLNRRGFVEAAERELARARRYRSPFVLAYVDVRGLKAVNDSEGHLAGDEVITRVAELLGDSVRAEDAVGRLGGDELALLLTGQSAEGAEAVVERIHASVPSCREAMGISTDWDLTIGTAAYPADGATFEELVSMADRRLYEQRGIQLR
jgi:diguanylate cyclase (GGDEF)-like protein